MRVIEKPKSLLVFAMLTTLILSVTACTENYRQKNARVHAVVVDLSARIEAPYPILYKHKGDRLIWFASQASEIVVHLGSNPIPFADMTDGSGAPCAGGGDCQVHCYPDSSGSVCVSGQIIIPNSQLPAAGIEYSYDSRLVMANAKPADPGFIIRP